MTLWQVGGMGLVAVAAVLLLMYQIWRGQQLQAHKWLQMLQWQLAEQKAQLAAAQTEGIHQMQTHMQLQLQTTLQQLGQMQGHVQHLGGSVGEQLGSQQKVMHEVQERLGALFEATRTLHTLSKDIAQLQTILRTPQLRGGLGEWLLEEMLREVLPRPAYALQYRLQTAAQADYVVADAAIFLAERMVLVDSKFPLESFVRLQQAKHLPNEQQKPLRRAFWEVIKKHIDCVADKYIRPDLNTFDFALCYLPAESMFYEAMVASESPDTVDSPRMHAAKRRVVVVSPNTFYAYLLTVAYGLKGLRIEQEAQTMRKQLALFLRKLALFGDAFTKMGKHLQQAQHYYGDSEKRYSALSQMALRLSEDDDTNSAEEVKLQS